MSTEYHVVTEPVGYHVEYIPVSRKDRQQMMSDISAIINPTKQPTK